MVTDEELVSGIELPELIKEPDEVAVFFYSAATWNGHRIHWDRDHARSEGHADMVVQGPLQANWIIELVTSCLGTRSRITHLRYRNVAPAYVNRRYSVHGTVRGVERAEESGETVVTVDVHVDGPSGITTKGEAVALLSAT